MDVDELRARLAEAEETLRAIRHGEVDALLIEDESGERVYTLRGAEAPYRAFVEQMQEGAATLTTRGAIVYSNARFADLVGASLQSVIGASIYDFIEPSDEATLRGMLLDSPGGFRTRLRHRTRSPIDVHVSISSVMLDTEEHRTLIVTDLSILTKMQRESRSKDEFLAMLAHELRNPLGAISAAIQVLAGADLRETSVVRARAVIQRQTLHMARLVDDLLDVGRVMIGKVTLDQRPLNLAEAVRASVSAVAASPQADGRVETSLAPLWVSADAVRLEQVVGNLISNALKFTPPGGLIRVSVEADAASGCAVLRVTDQGAGVEADLLPHIFDLFVQAEDTLDRARGGLGIGLTLVRRLVELQGGSVEASSAGRGHGCTFTVRFPIVPKPETVAADTTRGAQPTRRRVLLVDDDADARDMYEIVLQVEGHEVYVAGDALEALETIRRVAPDVAVVDIGLPGVDGYELAKRIRSEPEGRDVILIALTGYGCAEDRVRSDAAGFDRHLVKPAALAELRRELSRTRTLADSRQAAANVETIGS